MRIVLIILIGIHGIIHLFGFLKAFGFSDFEGISQAISKPYGILWLITFLLFSSVLLLLFLRIEYWWFIALISIILSQFLIISVWSDAKFGTIANSIILCTSLIVYANQNFDRLIHKEIATILTNSELSESRNVNENDIAKVPEIVQKWLRYSGITGKPYVENIYLTQDLNLKLKPEQKDWTKGTAKQYFTVQPPAFNWSINSSLNPILSIKGRDKYENGHGEMLIKLLSLIPVANAKNDEKINEATLQRFLAEIVWFPSAALNDYIHWNQIDEDSAEATMNYKGVEGSGIFHFNDHGQFTKFEAMRFKDSKDNKPIKWTITATKTDKINGIKIPVECTAKWHLKSGEWTWLKLNISNIKYNVSGPVNNHDINNSL